MKILKKLKIWWYKRKARAAYIAYRDMTTDYSRSQFLIAGDSAKARKHAQTFNECVRKLRSLGEKVPECKL